MKSVLIGADILKLEDDYKLLEINTDADLFLPDIPYLDLEPLFTYLVVNSYTKLVVIYKTKHISEEVIALLQEKCNLASITFEPIIILNNSVTIPSIIDEDSVFYLRCAYDTTAIIDDTYCRDKSEVAKLLFDSNNQSILSKTYVKYSGDGSILDNLSSPIDNGVLPNIIAKKILPDFDKIGFPAFYNIDTEEKLDELKTSISDNVMLQELKINSNLSADGQISDVIRMTVIVLSDIETIIPLGITITNNQLPLDSESITYTNNKLDNKWKTMFFSNPNLLAYGVPEYYEVTKIVNNVEEIVSIESLVAGDIVKSIKLPELSVNTTMPETMNWYSTASLSDVIIYQTASVQFVNKIPYEGWLVNIEYGDGNISGSSLLATAEILLISSSVDNKIKFETAYESKVNDLVITDHNLLLPITNKENVWYSGSIIMIDIEPTDVFVAGTSLNEITKNSVGNIILHNKCAWSGFCCFGEDTLISLDGLSTPIKNVNVGDLVWSYNFNTNTKELKEVLEIQSPIHSDIIEVTLSNGIKIINTFDHPYYNINGDLISYNPSKTMEWYNGNVLEMKIGDSVYNENHELIQIVDIVEIINPIQTYTLFVKDNQNFYANGVLVYDEQK
jgi:hypothetical protein